MLGPAAPLWVFSSEIYQSGWGLFLRDNIVGTGCLGTFDGSMGVRANDQVLLWRSAVQES